MSVRSFCLLWRVRVRVLLHGACGSPARRTDGDGITAARQLNYRAALGAKGVLRRGASCADDGDTESRHGAGPSSSGAQDGLAGGDLPFFVQDATNLAWNKESRTSVQAQANQDFLRGGKGGYSGGLQLQDGCLLRCHGCLARGGGSASGSASGSSHVTISRVTVSETNRCSPSQPEPPFGLALACASVADGSILNPRMGRDHFVFDSSKPF